APQIDKAAELQAKWGTARGQVWEIGKHRLMCGDAVECGGTLFRGRQDSLMITDPPYGCDYGDVVSSRVNQKVGGWSDIEGDSLNDEELLALLSGAFKWSRAPIAIVWYGF